MKVDLETIKNKILYINSCGKRVNIMEVCGTHTMAISKFGLREIIRSNINLISGPGCPVCVTPDFYLDYVYYLSLEENITIATYGDMVRVPGSETRLTLENARALGADIKVVYSTMDALDIAKGNSEKKVVFLGIGFETTAPATAVAVLEAEKLNIDNFFVLSLHKKVEPVMRMLLEDKNLKIDGFLCPGHVAAIIGEEGFEFLEGYNCPGSIAGFELQEILDGICGLIKNIDHHEIKVHNYYRSIVKKQGNKVAGRFMDKIFVTEDDHWRGMGLIKKSGLKIRAEYGKYDIEKFYPIQKKEYNENNRCQCGDVLKGKIKPMECRLFQKACTPENPIGPCMVSAEGSCSAFYRYNCHSILT